MSEKPRLHIEPYGEHFVVYDGEDFLFICETRRAAEREMKLRQAQIEISERFAAQDAEIARLKEEKTAHEHAKESGEASGESRRDAAELRIDFAKALIIEAATVKPALTRSQIFKQTSNKKKWEPEGLKPYGRSVIYTLITELIEGGEISPPPNRRR
jgi:hypothetical protein